MKKGYYLLLFSLCFCLIIGSSCEKKAPEATVKTESFEVTIDENPIQFQSLGFLSTTSENTKYLNYEMEFSEDPDNLYDIISILSTGELSIIRPRKFDFEKQPSLLGFGRVTAYNHDDVPSVSTFRIKINLRDIISEPIDPFHPIQRRLDAGESPFEIYESDFSLLDTLYGRSYAGGLIFFLDAHEGYGLVVSRYDQNISMPWAPATLSQVSTGTLERNTGFGKQHTDKIILTLGDSGSYAAKYCNDLVLEGYTNWHLPSLNELDIIYKRLYLLEKDIFQPSGYWSTTERTDSTALARVFDPNANPYVLDDPKTKVHNVRAVREFRR